MTLEVKNNYLVIFPILLKLSILKGPIYAYKTDAKGKINEEKVLGYAVGSPDVRPNAPCLDGHTVFAQLITEGLYIWID